MHRAKGISKPCFNQTIGIGEIGGWCLNVGVSVIHGDIEILPDLKKTLGYYTWGCIIHGKLGYLSHSK